MGEALQKKPSQEGRFLFNCHDRGMKAYLDRRWNTWGAARLAERVRRKSRSDGRKADTPGVGPGDDGAVRLSLYLFRTHVG